MCDGIQHQEDLAARLGVIQTDKATGKAKELLEAVQTKLSMNSEQTRIMANSPAVLDAYLSFSSALAGGSLNAKLREQIAVAIGEQNSQVSLRDFRTKVA